MPKGVDAIRAVSADGWELARIRGSHRVYKHPKKQGAVVIAGSPSKDLATGTWNNILRQAGLK